MPAQGDRVREPQQRRAVATKRTILDAVEEVLASDGVEGCTTRAVAKVAGVNVATLYSYFPDRWAMIVEVVRNYETERSSSASMRLDLVSSPDWRSAMHMLLLDMARARTDRPAGMELRRVVRGSPELQHLDQESTTRTARRLARELRVVSPSTSPAHAGRVARLVVVTATEALDDACRTGRIDTDAVQELAAMLAAYLAPIIEGR